MIKNENAQNNVEIDKIKDNSNSSERNEPKYFLDIFVSANRLKAYLRVKLFSEDAKINVEDIYARLKEEKVTYGIKTEDIKNYCVNKEFYKELVVAEGKAPKNGTDAYIKYYFDFSDNIRFREKEDGTIDFKNIDNIKTVHKDNLLCEKINAVEGINGIDVMSNIVPCPNVKDISLPTGKNTYISDDGLKLLSSVDGCVHMKNNSINVDSVYTVASVDHSTGNIDFLGSVVINGDVKSGFTVKAKNDITVRGMVEGATLISGGDISISNGMNGRNTGKIKAEGNVTSKYIENCEVNADKNVYSGAIINSNVYASKSIMLRGERATIIGGECKAGEIISAKTIGTKNNISTKISIDLEQYSDQNTSDKGEVTKLDQEIKVKVKDIKELERKIKLVLPYIKKSQDNEKIYKLAILKKIEMTKELGALKAKKLEFLNRNKKIEEYKILCSGIIYANTRISIGWMNYVVREDLSYSKIYNNGSDIEITALLPSDINPEV